MPALSRARRYNPSLARVRDAGLAAEIIAGAELPIRSRGAQHERGLMWLILDGRAPEIGDLAALAHGAKRRWQRTVLTKVVL